MTIEAQRRIGLRLKLASGVCSIPLHRVHHLAGYGALSGEAEDYFLGWLRFHGELVPVFDLNRVVCDVAGVEVFGSRIILVAAAESAPMPYIGLLATGVTDTVAANERDVPELELDAYLPLLYTLIPPLPVEEA